jgi:general secretion pathway protein D
MMEVKAGRAAGASAFAVLALASLFWVATLASAPTATALARLDEDGKIFLKYKLTPLSSLVLEIAKATGETFAFDPSLTGRFTITISHPVTKAEALAILDATLFMQGYAVLRGDDGVYKVVAVTDARTGSKWIGPGDVGKGETQLTTMIKLELASAQEVASQIAPLVGKHDRMVPYPPTNSLILAGSEKRIRRLMELVRALDAGGLATTWVRTLRYRGALEIAEMLGAWAAPRDPKGIVREGDLRVWPDERSNSLILMGSSSRIEGAREFIDELDRAPEVDTAIQVVRIYHREAEELEQILVTMSAGEGAGAGNRGKGKDKAAGANLIGRPFSSAADPATNSIVIDADRETLRALLEVISFLDRPQPRIQVDVIAYEVSNPTTMRLGVDWFLPTIVPNSAQDTAMTITSNPSGGGLRGEIGEDITFFGRASREPLLIPFVDETGQTVDVVLPRETIVITANSRAVTTRVLMRPRLMMVSGEEQRLFAGENVPIPVGSPGELSAIQTSNRIERKDVGIELRVTSRVGEGDRVVLDLDLEISRIALSQAGSTELVGPTFQKREIQTRVQLGDGELAVIGLSQDGARQSDESGTPFLKDIPILGHLVKSGGSSGVDTHIVFAVQARLLKTHDEDLAESIRQRLALERSMSRVSGLTRRPGVPYAVLVTSRASREEAESIAAELAAEGGETQIGAWTWMGEESFDVYLTGYAELSEAGDDAMRLRERGFGPEVVVLPGVMEVAQTPGLKLLGARPEVSSAYPPLDPGAEGSGNPDASSDALEAP